MFAMFALSLNQQIDQLASLAATRRVHELNPATDVYSDLLTAFQGLLPLDESKLLLAAHAVFGWMPTQIQFNVQNLSEATSLVKLVVEENAVVTEGDLKFLSETFRTQNGKSVVAVSKVLHFFAPERFPIWDRRVCETWGRPPSGPEAAKHYGQFCVACHQIAEDSQGIDVCDRFRRRLADQGFDYSMSAMRIIELILFLRGS